MKGKEEKVGKKKRSLQKGISRHKRINLAIIGEKRVKWGFAIPFTVLIIALAVAFSKFLVTDRIAKVSEAEREAYEVEAQLEEIMRKIDSLEGLSGRYHHYSISGLSDEERKRVRRQDVMKVIEDVSDLVVDVDGFQLNGNSLTVNVSAEQLKSISEMIGRLENEELIDTISISTAQTENDGRRIISEDELASDERIRAIINIYLNERGYKEEAVEEGEGGER